MARSAITSRQTLNLFQNLFIRSSEFNTSPQWTKDAATVPTVTVDQIANPLTGAVDADLLNEGPGSGFHRIYQGTFAFVVGSFYTVSCYFKDNTARYASINVDGSTEFAVIADLQTGTITDSYASGNYSDLSTAITNMGNGWYRLSITVRIKVSIVSYIALSTSATGLISGLGHAGAGKSLYIWGAQLVRSNWPGDYVATAGSAVSSNIRHRAISRTTITSRALIA